MDDHHVVEAAGGAGRVRIVDPDLADGRLSGYDRHEMIGRDVRDLWPTEPAVLRTNLPPVLDLKRSTETPTDDSSGEAQWKRSWTQSSS